MSAKSISQCKGKGSIGHNNREFFTDNIDRNRTGSNIVFINQPISEAYKELFNEAVERYNSKQTRNDRKISDYYESLFHCPPCNSVLTSANKRNSFYEDLVQVGDKDDCGCGTPNGKLAVRCLTEYMNDFHKRNPNFHVFNAVLHVDEATPHLHINYIPIGHYTRGMDTQNGYNQALKEMGFTGANCFRDWRERERDVLRGICKAHGLEIKSKEEEKGRGHSFTVEGYKEAKEAKKTLETELKPLQAMKVKTDRIEEKKTAIPLTGKTIVSTAEWTQTVEQAKAYCVNSDEIKDMRKTRKEIEKLQSELAEREKVLHKMELETAEAYRRQQGINRVLEQTEKALATERSNNAVLRAENEAKVKSLSDAEKRNSDALNALNSVVKATGMLKYGKSGGYKVENLTSEQERLIDAVTNYGIKIAKKAERNDLAEEMEKKVGIILEIKSEINKLTPQESTFGRGGR